MNRYIKLALICLAIFQASTVYVNLTQNKELRILKKQLKHVQHVNKTIVYNEVTLEEKIPTYYTCEVTAYTHTGNPTKSGEMPQENYTVASDWSVFPVGTKLKVEGFDNLFVVKDTGRDIKGSRLDIFMDTKQEAKQFGRRTLQVQVVE